MMTFVLFSCMVALEDGEVGINCAKLITKYTIFAIPDNFVAH